MWVYDDGIVKGMMVKDDGEIQSTPKAYGHYTLYDAWSVDGDKGSAESPCSRLRLFGL